MPRVRNHTVTVDIDEIQNVISIDLITPAQIFEEARQITKVEYHDDVPSQANKVKLRRRRKF